MHFNCILFLPPKKSKSMVQTQEADYRLLFLTAHLTGIGKSREPVLMGGGSAPSTNIMSSHQGLQIILFVKLICAYCHWFICKTNFKVSF